MYVEVKPIELNELEIEKATLLAELSGKDVWLAVGVPEAKEYWMILADGSGWWRVMPQYNDDNELKDMRPCLSFDVDDDGNIKDYTDFTGNIVPKEKMYPHIFQAVEAAKSARFEKLKFN